MATSKRTRVFMGFLAGLFLLTSSALTIGVIWQSSHSSDNSTANSQQDAATAQKTPKNQLQGTKLANFTPGTPIPQLKAEDTKVGTGAIVKAGDTVTVDYTGAVAATGVIFQSSKDTGQPVPVALKSGPNGVIDGWAQGVPGMKVGGTRRLLIPAKLAYGANPQQGSGIPPNADLVFDVTVQKIGK